MQGQFFDDETRLRYNRFRYYCPEIGAFVSQDPLGLADGENVYRLGPNTQKWIDPLGLCKKKFKSVKTDYGDAEQSHAPEAIAARKQVENRATLYRTGTMGKSDAADAQFWALEHPNTPGYAQRYGIPPENVARADFIETATLKPGTTFVTRQAPAVGTNPGDGIELLFQEEEST